MDSASEAKFALRLEHLTVRYGNGCPLCLARIQVSAPIQPSADASPDSNLYSDPCLGTDPGQVQTQAQDQVQTQAQDQVQTQAQAAQAPVGAEFPAREGAGNRCPRCGTVWAARDISLMVREGEILGVVGESGSGKSTLMQALYLDIEPTGGAYYLSGYQHGATDIFTVSSQQRKHIRDCLLGMVYQNPHLGLRMRFSAGANVAEKLLAAGSRHVGSMMERTNALLTHMEVPISRVKEPPRNFSGGMQQRVQIAKAVANNPPILLLDEVTTGLDLSVQARVLDLVKHIQRDFDITMIVVSHDLAVVRMLADRTVVMLNGRIIEQGITDQIMEDPQHVYTQTLVNSLL